MYAAMEFGRRTAERGMGEAILAALVPTCVLLGALSLALAQVKFEWAADVLDRNVQQGLLKPEDLIESIAGEVRISGEWPRLADFFYKCELVLASLGAIALVVLIWWPVLSSPHTPVPRSFDPFYW